MPSAYNASVAQVQINGTYLGEEVQNTLWFETGVGPITATMLTVLASEVLAWWQTNMAPLVSSQYLLREIAAYDWSSGTGPVGIVSAPAGTAGQNVNAASPGNVALVLTIRSGRRGRSSRGRNFIAGLTENIVTGNQITQVAVDAFIAAYDELLTPATFTEFNLVVYSQFSGNQVRPVGEAYTAVAITADANVDSMRRRLAGRGR